MKKILIIFGTRPEAIKLSPVIKRLRNEKIFEILVCSTGQHNEMLKQVLNVFKITVDVNLSLMKNNQDLNDLTSAALSKLKKVLKDFKPDLLIVQGDTTTAFAAALSAFYFKIKIAHVEAGLRSHDNYSPFPEEGNRKIISVLSDFHFAPTESSKINLITEGIEKKKIIVTGNTVIDSLMELKKRLAGFNSKKLSFLPKEFFKKKFILITLHRREKFGSKFLSILNNLNNIASKHADYNFIYPIHLNPNIKVPAKQILGNTPNIILSPPLDYLSFIFLMSKCYFIISDSGGIQEECFVFKKPVIVLRDKTERMEAVHAGYAFLSDEKNLDEIFNLVDKKLRLNLYLFKGKNPFGDGKASLRINNFLKGSYF